MSNLPETRILAATVSHGIFQHCTWVFSGAKNKYAGPYAHASPPSHPNPQAHLSPKALNSRGQAIHIPTGHLELQLVPSAPSAEADGTWQDLTAHGHVQTSARTPVSHERAPLSLLCALPRRSCSITTVWKSPQLQQGSGKKLSSRNSLLAVSHQKRPSTLRHPNQPPFRHALFGVQYLQVDTRRIRIWASRGWSAQTR